MTTKFRAKKEQIENISQFGQNIFKSISVEISENALGGYIIYIAPPPLTLSVHAYPMLEKIERNWKT